jgi:hypothetical protein
MLLKEIVASKKTRQFDYFTKQLMSGEAVDQRKLDFLRGWWAGCDYVIANPENAEATFDAAMKQAQAYDEGNDE